MAGSPTGVSEALVVDWARHDNLGAWSLGGRKAEAVTGEAKETLKRRTRRTYSERPCDGPGAMGN